MQDDTLVQFTLDGQVRELRRSDVDKSLTRMAPEPVRSHSVEIGGQVVSRQASARDGNWRRPQRVH